MEQDDEQPTEPQVHHHTNNDSHYASHSQTQPLIHATKLSTSSTSFFPPPEQLDFPMMYPGLMFNPNTHNNHHQPYPEACDGVVGTATRYNYLGVAPGAFKSCSEGNVGACASFSYMSNTCSSRWPREETMSLLQIRTHLHSSFKQATHKGPLWDEVSRIMYEEHGYQRSGKKCREKFENLYKYYKKTKEAKSGKHDGKNYRFFRQLEALYGDQVEVDHLAPQPNTVSSQTLLPLYSNNQVKFVGSSQHLIANDDQESSPNNQLHITKLPCDQSCLSLSNQNSSSHFTSSSSEDNNKRNQNKKKKMKIKIKEFIDIQMKSLMEQQQHCLEKVMETVEQKEKERVLREVKWRQQAEERLEEQHKLWANERAWMKARDAALMDTLQYYTSARPLASTHSHMQQGPAFSPSSVHPVSLMNKKPAECSSVRDRLALYNSQESQDSWFMASNHHSDINGFRVMMSDGSNVGNGGSLLWDGSSFGLKLNNGDENHQT